MQTHRPQNPNTSHSDSPSTDAPAHQAPGVFWGYGEPLHKNHTSVQSWKAEELVKKCYQDVKTFSTSKPLLKMYTKMISSFLHATRSQKK